MTLQFKTPLVEFKTFGYLINKASSSRFKLSKIFFPMHHEILNSHRLTVRTKDFPLDWKQQIRWIDLRSLDLLSFVVFFWFGHVSLLSSLPPRYPAPLVPFCYFSIQGSQLPFVVLRMDSTIYRSAFETI